jgi:hypothetical protein
MGLPATKFIVGLIILKMTQQLTGLNRANINKLLDLLKAVTNICRRSNNNGIRKKISLVP